ncbi:hypothetical protein GCM10023067_42920 [Aminobacter aganoensis]
MGVEKSFHGMEISGAGIPHRRERFAGNEQMSDHPGRWSLHQQEFGRQPCPSLRELPDSGSRPHERVGIGDVEIDVRDVAVSTRHVDNWYQAKISSASEILQGREVPFVREHYRVDLSTLNDLEDLAEIAKLRACLREQSYPWNGYVELFPYRF